MDLHHEAGGYGVCFSELETKRHWDPRVTMNFSSRSPAARKTFVLLSISVTDLVNETWGFRTLSWSVWPQRCPASSPGIFCYPECVPEVEKTWLLTLMAHLLPSLKGVGAPFAPVTIQDSRCPSAYRQREAVTKGSLEHTIGSHGSLHLASRAGF